MEHHQDEEARLAFRETEQRQRMHTLVVGHPGALQAIPQLVCSGAGRGGRQSPKRGARMARQTDATPVPV